ncbi:hypothetical protein [Micromonospora psammae]|uniref:hypothetical protein n=1 Tax=Micromonospora sp. CPCC 205556 TaxID=3122398 RepID=UPI002FEF8B37
MAAGLAVSAPAQAADEFRTITRDGIVLQYHRVAKTGASMKGTGVTRSDFDGDGVDDIAAVGDPFNHNLPHYPTGAVAVRYSSAAQVDYFFGAMLSDNGGSFGSAIVAGNFNGDAYDDLAVGDADEADPRNKARAGGVWIIPGSSSGLVVDSAKHFNQSSPGVPGDPENLDWFGASLAAGDLNGDGRDDLAVGAYSEAIGTKAQAGAVTVLFGGAGGLTATGAQYFHQDQAAVPGAAERNDQFGRTLAIGKVNGDRYADLAIGAPMENDGSSSYGTGIVTLLRGSAGGVSSTGVTAVTGAGVHGATGDRYTIAWYLGLALTIGDVNGDGLGEVIAGAPSAQTPQLDGGLITVFTGRTGGLSGSAVRVITQRTTGVPGDPESGDRFGAALAAGDVTGDGKADVLVGAPGEAIGSTGEAGVVTLLKGAAGGLSGSGAQAFDQNHAVVPGSAERGDNFGARVALLNLNGTGGLDALVASPREEVSGDTAGYPSGTLSSFYGATGGLVPQSTSTSGLNLRSNRTLLLGYGSRIAAPESSLPLY